MTEIFISYKREDRNVAAVIAENLEKRGYEVWWDFNLIGGVKYGEETNLMLNKAKAVLVLWTPEAARSQWVIGEASVGLSKDKLVPIQLKSTEIPVPFNTLHMLDYTDWDEGVSPEKILSLIDAIELKLDEVPRKGAGLSSSEIEEKKANKVSELECWKMLRTKRKPRKSDYKNYLANFGENGLFSPLARRKIKELNRLSWIIRIVLVVASLYLGYFFWKSASKDSGVVCCGLPWSMEPAENEPAETEPVETEPVETEPIETEPIETGDNDLLKPISYTQISEDKLIDVEPKSEANSVKLVLYDNRPSGLFGRFGNKVGELPLPYRMKVVEKYETPVRNYKWLKVEYEHNGGLERAWFSWGNTKTYTYSVSK